MNINKTQAKEKIEEFFKDIKNKNQGETRKIKKLAMKFNLKLQDKRKLFCQKCYSTNLVILGIKKKIKRVKCNNCSKVYKWKV